MKAFLSGLFSFGLVLCLVGCGGSGGVSIGTDTSPDLLISFERWSLVNFPQTVEVYGVSQDATFTVDGDPPETSFDNKGVSSALESKVTIEYDFNGVIESVQVETPTAGILKWDTDLNDLILDGTERITFINDAGNIVGAAINPLRQAWDYQSFGVWEDGVGLDEGALGGISFGAPTGGSTGGAIPDTGIVQFVGETLGIYIDAAGDDYLTYGDLTVDLDFAHLTDANALELNTSNTRKMPIGNLPNGADALDADLNFKGWLTYDANTNRFTGPVAAGGGLIGTSTGQFYGPNAEELGGVFSLSSGGGAFYSGAYGAAR